MNTVDLSYKIIKNSEIFADVMSACSTLLKHNKEAIEYKEYLNSRVPPNTKEFNFGYFPKNNNLNDLFEFVSEEKLRSLDIVYNKNIADNDVVKDMPHNIFHHHNLIMPYKNIYGDIIAIVGRTLLSSEEQSKNKISKYKNSFFQKGLHLFGLYNAKQHIIDKNSVILVEGQFDCISCHIRGFKNVVAVGSANLSKYQFHLLKRFTNNIFILFDNDNAGEIGADKIIKRFGSSANIKKLSLNTKYKDVDEFLKNETDYSCLFER